MCRLRVRHVAGVTFSKNDVVGDNSLVSFSRFESPRQTKVVVDFVVGGTIVQVDVPSVIALHPVVAKCRDLIGIPERAVRIGLDPIADQGLAAFVFFSWTRWAGSMPVTVASPRIKCSVVMRFQHGLETIVPFDDVSAPSAIADIDCRAWCIENRIVTDGNPRRH